MWEDNSRKRLIINLILILGILAIGVCLLVAMLMVRRQNREHDEQLSEIYVQQQQQQAEARQESVIAIQEEYEKDMETVAEYLPGIVCWGDSVTLGSSGNISYPAVLKVYLDSYFCDIYDFRSTIENADDYARLKWDDYKVSVPVVNMGGGKENSLTVLGRSGAMPFVLGADVTIPADTEPVEVRLKSENKNDVNPLTGGDAGINNVTIGGIEGALSINSSQYYSKYYFTRLTAGEEIVMPAGTVVKTAATDLYRDYIHIVWIGTFGNTSDPEELVRQVKTLLARQTKNTERFLVLGPCSINGSFYPYAMNNIDAAMMQVFGSRYVNVRKYLMEDGLADAGLTSTKEDLARIKEGGVPKSFVSSADASELNGRAYTLIGKLVYNRMETLGYFDEVYDELGIRETTKQILKDNPKYFETIIANTLK